MLSLTYWLLFRDACSKVIAVLMKCLLMSVIRNDQDKKPVLSLEISVMIHDNNVVEMIHETMWRARRQPSVSQRALDTSLWYSLIKRSTQVMWSTRGKSRSDTSMWFSPGPCLTFPAASLCRVLAQTIYFSGRIRASKEIDSNNRKSLF